MAYPPERSLGGAEFLAASVSVPLALLPRPARLSVAIKRRSGQAVGGHGMGGTLADRRTDWRWQATTMRWVRWPRADVVRIGFVMGFSLAGLTREPPPGYRVVVRTDRTARTCTRAFFKRGGWLPRGGDL